MTRAYPVLSSTEGDATRLDDSTPDPQSADLPRRVRAMLRQGVTGSAAMTVLDVAYARWVYPDMDLVATLGLRGLTLVIFLVAAHPLRPRTGRQAWAALYATGCFASTIFALITHLTGGLLSLYPLILFFLSLGSVTLARPWKEVLRLHGTTTLVYLAAFGALLPWFPASRAQLGVVEDLGRFGFLLFGICVSAVVSAQVSDVLGSMRREVFESKRVGRYILRSRIGRGGMGEVWTAWHVGLRREVAVKFLHAHLDDTTARRRFEREARATAALSHPNTVRILDVGVGDDGQPYYAMELLAGSSLRDLVEREGSLAPDRALVLAEQAARALAEAHDRGIVHRDVKPENLFVCALRGDEQVKLLDFGIARMAAEEDAARLTATGLVIGTPAFMAPELATGREAGPASDVYALGATLYFALTGAPPFAAESATAVLLAHLSDPVPRLTATRFGPLPVELTDLIARALAKAPVDRPTDGAELARALAAIPRTGASAPVATEPLALGDADFETRALRR